MKQSFTICLILFSFFTNAQNVGIGTTNPDATAQLDVSSNTKGILIPRMTLAQRTAIASPAQGLLVYQTDGIVGFYVNRSSGLFPNWSLISEGANLWTTSLGNSNYITNTNTGNVGIGTNLPPHKFTVNNGDSAITLFNNSQTLATNINSNIYIGTGVSLLGGYYTGAIRTTGTSASTARIGLYTGASSNANNLAERLSIDNAGNVGVGITTPSYLLDINGRSRIRHNGNTAGLWLNKADNTEGSFIGMINDTTAGFWGNATSGSWKVAVDVKNGLMGIGTTDPTAPLSFASSLGNKISLWGDATGGHYGLGIQGGTMQLYTDANNGNIVLGYGNSNAFTENVKFLGNGNIHIGEYGAWANAQDNRKINFGDGDFVYVGEQDADDRLVLRASSFDFRTGNVFIGATDFTKGAGYKLRVNGKIIAEEVRVQLVGAWPDYVFADDYKKLTIPQLEDFIKVNKHLPNVPTASDIEKDGQLLGELQKKMMEKIEEMSLYIIEQHKEIELLKQQVKNIENK